MHEGLTLAGPQLAAQTQSLSSQFDLELLAPVELGDLQAFFHAFRPLQSYEAWAYFGQWIAACQPGFGPGVSDRFAAAAQVNSEEAEQARTLCLALRARVRDLLGEDTLLCMPTVSSAAPALNASAAQVDAVRQRTLCMTAVAGVCGLPQLSMPLLRDDRGPVGLSLIGPAGSDLQLLQLAAQWELQRSHQLPTRATAAVTGF